MQTLLASVISLFVSLLFVNAGNSYLLTLIGVQLGLNNAPPMDVGYIMSSYAIGFVTGTLFTPALLKKVGHIRAFSALASVTGMAAISYPFSDAMLFWCLLRAVGGFVVAGLFVVIESWVSSIASNENRSKIFAIYLVAAYSASALGQLAIGYASEQGVYFAFALAGLLIFSSIIPLSISSRNSPSVENSTSMSPFRLARRALLGLVGAVLGGMLLSSFYGLVPLYGSLSEMTPEDIGSLMFSAVVAAMVSAWPIGWLSDRIPRSTVLVGVLLAGTGAAIVVYLLGRYIPSLIYICIPVIMASFAAIYSISVAITNDLVENEERIAASSTLLMGYGVGSIIGPIGGSWLMESMSADALFLGFACVTSFLIVFATYRQFKQSPIPVELQDQFVPTIPEVQVNGDINSPGVVAEDEPQNPVNQADTN
jgi:MFS family permease